MSAPHSPPGKALSDGRLGARGNFAEFERDPPLDQLRVAAQHDPFDDGPVRAGEVGPQSDLFADLVDDRSDVPSRARVPPTQDGRDLRQNLVLVVDAIDGAHQRVDLLGHPGTHLLDLGPAEIARPVPFGFVSALLILSRSLIRLSALLRSTRARPMAIRQSVVFSARTISLVTRQETNRAGRTKRNA
jgi:hypothetical protein